MINREDLLSGTRPQVGNRILMTVENHFQGYEIIDYKGMVWGISMRSKDMGQDILMNCKQVTGGELSSYTELADEGRQRAIDRMLSMAKRIGANAVINFKFEQNLSTYNSNTEVTAFGNAVVIRPIKNYVPTGGLGNILAEFYDSYVQFHSKQAENNNQIKKEEYKIADLVKSDNKILVKCPYCGNLYNAAITSDKHIIVKTLDDADVSTKGQQIKCINCNQIFTVPHSL